jgi:hypothetical protein
MKADKILRKVAEGIGSVVLYWLGFCAAVAFILSAFAAIAHVANWLGFRL